MNRRAALLIAAVLTPAVCVFAALLPSAAGGSHTGERLRQRPPEREGVDKLLGHVTRPEESPRLYLVWLNGKTGFIDDKGRLVIPAKFEHRLFHTGNAYGEEGAFSDGMARIAEYGGTSPNTSYPIYRYGYIDTAGTVVVPPRYEEAQHFSEGLAAVKVSTFREGYNTTGDRYGYIDKTGRMAIPARFYVAGSFSEGLANVCEEGDGCGYIDRAGRMVLPLRFSGMGEFRDGMATVLTAGGNDGIIDREGRLVYEGRFPSLRPRWFYEGLAGVLIGDKWGYIDKAGRVVIGPAYDGAGDFSEGLAPVELKGKYGYIDKAGAMVIEPRFVSASGFSGGLAVIGADGRRGYLDRKYGYIDKAGRVVSPPQFYLAESFSEGLAKVEVQDGRGRVTCGYIDATGRMVIKPRFHEAYRFSGGIAKVKPTADRLGYIDRTGRYVWRPAR